MRGLRKYLTPFAPDQSGAVSVYMNLAESSSSATREDAQEMSAVLMSEMV